MTFPVSNPSVPFLASFDDGLSSGQTVQIIGSVPADVTGFFLNLLCGDSEGSPIAVHVNPRFQEWETAVVFNHLGSEGWGDEERPEGMPFLVGETFELLITVTDEGYLVKVNGADFHTFLFRIPADQVRSLQIGGTVVVETINVI